MLILYACLPYAQVRRILSSSAAQKVRVGAGAEAGDPDVVAAQQARLLALSVRTLASPYGRGALTLRAWLTAWPMSCSFVPSVVRP
jgi:hypothetical protein